MIRRLFRRCPHARVRCIHGDEILAAITTRDAWTGADLRRARCLDCGKALDRSLPEPCSWTGRPHHVEAGPPTHLDARRARPADQTEGEGA